MCASFASAQAIDQSQPVVGLQWSSLSVYPTQSFRPSTNMMSGAGAFLSGGTTPQDITFELWDGQPHLFGSQLITIGRANGVQPNGWVDAFWTPVPVTPGAEYFLSIRNLTSFLTVQAEGTNLYPHGRFGFSPDDGTTWVYRDSTDLTFRTWEPGLGFHLTSAGSCPGPIQIYISGATPFGLVAFAYGTPGTYAIPSGPCAGTILDISNVTLAAILPADATGSITIAPLVPAGVCGLTLQSVDLTHCLVSPTVVL